MGMKMEAGATGVQRRMDETGWHESRQKKGIDQRAEERWDTTVQKGNKGNYIRKGVNTEEEEGIKKSWREN